jgi:hypothetical protein
MKKQNAARVLPLTQYVSADDVVRALGCSRSTAYRHLAAAANRPDDARGLLRVPLKVWESYAAATFGTGADMKAARPDLAPLRARPRRPAPVRVAANTNDAPIPITRARARRVGGDCG